MEWRALSTQKRPTDRMTVTGSFGEGLVLRENAARVRAPGRNPETSCATNFLDETFESSHC